MSRSEQQVPYRTITVLLFVLALALFGFAGYKWHYASSLARALVRQPLDYGERVNSDSLRQALASTRYSGSLDESTHLLLYFFRPAHFERFKSIKYGQMLRLRHGDKGLQVFVVTDAKPDEMQALVKTETLSLPVLYDDRMMLRLLLQVPEPYEHSFLIKSSGEIVFSAPGSPSEDLIRQIVEKYVVGKIDYGSPQPANPYRPGQAMPVIRAAPLVGGPSRNLAPRNAEVVLISARCASCQLNAYLDHYRSIAAPDISSKSRFIIFSQRFPHRELLADLTSRAIPLDNFYRAETPLGDIDNEYRTKSSEEAAMVLAVNHEGRITNIKPLQIAK